MPSTNTSRTNNSTNDANYVTIVPMILSGGVVFIGAAAVVGTAHWHSTAKQLKEEGIPLSARQRALPLAAKALVASTLACVFVGGMAAAAFTVFGGEYKDSTSLGSFSNALRLVQEQRDLVRQQFQRMLSGDGTPKSNDQAVKDVANK